MLFPRLGNKLREGEGLAANPTGRREALDPELPASKVRVLSNAHPLFKGLAS